MKLIKEILYCLSLPLIIVMTMAFKGFSDEKKMEHIKENNMDNGFAVIELFTSEGCWSCPPADELMARLEKDNQNKQLFIMAFHVDYWDHQGWKDRFSKRSFTERQKQYATWLNLNTLYTPQLVINGKAEMVGSETGKILSGIQSVMLESHVQNLSLQAEKSDGRNIQVSYTTSSAAKDTAIGMALVQKHASSQVSAGENAGKALSHVQIVRDFQSRTLQEKDTFSFKLPDTRNNWQIIAFQQHQKTGEIIDAAAIDL
ncbi:DUF1223 domain-containing protein [Chryseobacterium sp. G0240]|uniref:DUF1223 domain-containing protein n=1 Tax=Chryseobacterium sp. G0240 TaxID=2487066 RepID=UPI000F4553DD|nr:DUF1223 domain-containing protein [Chryseobacterium sp. G0240]ROI06601.1 DUF1223 domain-containing protein [Chryseobacterium sp. G0240]